MIPHEFSTVARLSDQGEFFWKLWQIVLTVMLAVLTGFSAFIAGMAHQRMLTAGTYMDQALQLNQEAADHELRARRVLQQLQALPHNQGFQGKGDAGQVSGV